jgi:PBSX family phage terminase large subunit
MHELKHGPKGDVMILGVNRGSIDRNILGLLYSSLGAPIPNAKVMQTRLYGRKVDFVGCPDIQAVSTIKGATLALAYVDEITEIPEAVFKMLEGRLSVPGAKLIGTTNPDGPAHWFKKQYIDNAEAIDLIHWDFNLEDNPSLDAEYKKRIKASYTGLWYNRYILGEWALASGAIYDSFDNVNIYENPYPAPNYYIVGIDYGTTNATAAVLCGITPNKWPQVHVEAEYYYDSAKMGRAKTDSELVRDIQQFIGHKNVSAIYVDPAAASLKIALRQADLPVLDANNDVLLGIKITGKFISGKNIVIHRSCSTLRDHIQSYAWDPKAADRGEDKPIKKNDHVCDALRYACCSAFPQGEFSNPDENLTIEQLKKKIFQDDGYGFMNPQGSGGYF